ncbi:TetR family transcriptional regulator [Pseudomonas sp. M47T1]|uniref:CerR family C-terminal domain-containing protein n=1 Tax=unclassified Pseudomonas TaxID=196821 RepID=UPI0002607AFD|nr:CerR family C-terminal domain-containing protein [Pseudomonas sp. M47T1]EIK97158.1 TetR family transcriptional regulator [Pseudomonas sp. M47T1]
MARHRPAKEGGYQRGEETRSRIIDAAMGLFAENGFDGASTRDIATAAGVNAPALQYYFDNKEGVYVACVDHILTHIWEQLSSVVTHAEGLLEDADATDAMLIDAYLDILGGFVAFIHDTPQSSDWRRFMAREQAGLGPPAAFEMMDQGFNRRLGGVTRGIVGRLIGRSAEDEVTIIRALAFNSQGMVFRVLRRPLLRALGWDEIDRVRMETVRTVLLSQNRLTLEALVRERLPGSV